MKKRGRLFIVLLVVVMCGFFLYPTIKWYTFVPQETKDLATGSKVQIREYALGQATRDLRALKELIRSDPNSNLPKEYKALIPIAKENYKAMKMAKVRLECRSTFQRLQVSRICLMLLKGYRVKLIDLKT